MSVPEEVFDLVSDLIYQLEHALFMSDHTNALRICFVPPAARELSDADAVSLASDGMSECGSDHGSDMEGFIVAASDGEEDAEMYRVRKSECGVACSWGP